MDGGVINSLEKVKEGGDVGVWKVPGQLRLGVLLLLLLLVVRAPSLRIVFLVL